jgi:hypothetical protein
VALLVAPLSARAATTFVVSNTNDMGAGSLRQAITDANATPGADIVDATGATGTIELESQLPFLSQDVEIRGPGASALTVRRDDTAPAFRIFLVLFQVKAEISGLTIANGRSESSSSGGGGVLNGEGTLTLRGTVVTANVNAGTSNGENGGAVFSDGGSPTTAATTTIIDSTVSDNMAAGYGAGIFNSSFSTLTLRNSTLNGNVAQGGAGCVGGGAIHNQGVLTVENSTVTGNVAPPNGSVGGILSCTTGGASNTIVDSTIAGNLTSPGGPANLGVLLQGAVTNSMTLRGTIVAQPSSGGRNCLVQAPATLTSDGYNLSDDASCNLTGPADQPGANPLLGPLAGNGGLTRTMAPAPGSPAIDRGVGDGLTTDQRGLTRPLDFPAIANAPGGDGSDVGAFELQAVPADFTLGKVKRNRRRGTATLAVIVPGPGGLELGRTRKVRGQSMRATAADRVQLVVIPGHAVKRKLRRRGKARVTVAVTYSPDTGTPSTHSQAIRLLKR